MVQMRKIASTEESTNRRYEFAHTLNFGFLASPEPLLNNCELKISFDRSEWQTALIEYGSVTTVCTEIKIEDCYAVTEYISSPRIRDYFEQINYNPITYQYEECDVIIKSIPQNETEIRFHNLRGGNTPSFVFAAIIPQAHLSGDKQVSSTRFTHNYVQEFNFMMNGNSVNGYPLQSKNGSAIYPLHKYLDTTGRLHNLKCGSTLNAQTFLYNWIWSHAFETNENENGWLGISFKLKQEYTEAMNLVVWIISDSALSIDKYHQIEKIN